MFANTNISIIIIILTLTVTCCVSLTTMNLPQPAARIKDEPESVWVEFIQLALDHKPLNLGQGFPDFAAPKYLVETLQNITDIGQPSNWLNNQYTRSFGNPRLVKALLRYYRDFRHFEQLKDANSQIIVTVGAYEALFASLMAFVSPGDEVIIVDPAFDAYAPIVAMAQGRSVFVPLRLRSSSGNSSTISSSQDYQLDLAELESKVNSKTKVLVLNTPNNPLGKMYSMEELEGIADICIRHNILVVADEVYEQMYYSPRSHLSIAQVAGMWNRTITIGSAGKTFSVTGWKVGWAFGASELIKYVQLVHQTAIYTVATPLQVALAETLEHEMELLASNRTNYWDELRADLVVKRDKMSAILAAANMKPIIPEGGYFMLADFSPLAAQFGDYWRAGEVSGRENSNDYRFARWLSSEKKLQGIPASAFYSPANKRLASNLIRFCFIKSDETLARLEQLMRKLSKVERSKM